MSSAKSIDTLVPDIYKVMLEGAALDETTLAVFGIQMSKLMKDKLTPRTKSATGKLWMSSIGKTDRQVWYSYNGYQGEKMDAPTLLKFLMGDIWEAIIILLAKAAGHEVTEEQKPVAIDGVTGRKDCKIDGITVDVKSASSYSFKKFQDGTLRKDDPFGYLYQIAGYREAEEVPGQTAAFLAADKQNGNLALLQLDKLELPNATKRIAHLKEVVASPTIPEKCYDAVPLGVSGNMKLPTGCSYCGFKKECWKDANDGKGLRTFIYSTGPVYLTKVSELPRVYEVK